MLAERALADPVPGAELAIAAGGQRRSPPAPTPDTAAIDRGPASGRPLPGDMQREMEVRLGWSLEDVRIHQDVDQHGLAARAGGRAVTVGSTIVFARGEYEPQTPRGRQALAHELVHVVQNAKGRGAVGPATGAGGLAGAISPAVTPLLRRIPIEGRSPRLDLANEQMRAKDRERAGTEVGPGLPYEELRRQGFDWVIDKVRSLREDTVELLRDQAQQRLPAALQTPVGALIDLVSVDLAVFTDLMLFNMSFALGVLESVAEMVTGMLALIVKLLEIAWHLVLASVYDIQDRLAQLGLADAPDEELIRPLAEDVAAAELLWNTLPEAIVGMLEGWLDRFLAASHEEKAVMAGDLVADLAVLIATWEASGTRLGKIPVPALPALAAEPELAAAVIGGARPSWERGRSRGLRRKSRSGGRWEPRGRRYCWRRARAGRMSLPTRQRPE